MRLPGIGKAEVNETKIVKYLLSTTHRAGKSKAAFFMAHGFDPQRWKDLDTALRQHAIDNEIAREERTIFGTRYVVDGVLKTPDGQPLNVRTVWFIDDDNDAPRFVTAHPLRRRRS
ncbi:MAG: DUF6883 domain-containing protein [Candidatus Binatia bacterium]